ncbi:MAG: CHASE2 domain-containing protein [Candidatus Kryptoniota bacterium]
MKSPYRKGKAKSLVTLPFLIAALSALSAFFLSREIPVPVPFLRNAEIKTIDQRFEYRGPIRIGDTSKVVIVQISDQSFEALPNSFPFPKRYYAKLIENLERAGAKAIGIDIVFDTPSKNPKDDSLLSVMLEKYPNVVLAGRTDIDISSRYRILKSQDFYNNIFAKTDSSIGIVFVRNDPDGIYRSYMPFAEFPTSDTTFKRIPTFGFEVAAKYLNLHSAIATNERNFFVFGTERIPKYNGTSILINYAGPSGSFPTYDIWQVLDDSTFTTKDEAEYHVQINDYYDLLSRKVFKGKVVLVGAAYPESGDLKPIPFTNTDGGNLAYGVEIHANAIETLLDRNFYQRSGWIFDFVEMFVGALIVSGVAFTSRNFKKAKSFIPVFLPLVATIIVGYISYRIAFNTFVSRRVVLLVIYPSIGFVLSYIGSVVYQYVSERKQKAVIKSIFSRYVHPAVVNQLVANPELVRLGGERKRLTVLFSDIANFTAVSEKLEPEALVEQLNEYLSAMTEVIFRYGGTLDKYIGDAIVAFWGAPVDVPDHAFKACEAACEMTSVLSVLHEKWQEKGMPLLNFRIGINTGDMIVGNVGGQERFAYTVIGDSVNLAARLETANKMYRTRILISQFTYELVKEKVFTRELDLIIVKGKSDPVRIYEVISIGNDNVDEKKKEVVRYYCLGLEKYKKRDWSGAAEFFEKALHVNPDDYPSEMYLERSRIFEIEPPSEEWNGVFVMQTK